MDEEGNFTTEVRNFQGKKINGKYEVVGAASGSDNVIHHGGSSTSFITRAIDLGLSVEWASYNLGAKKIYDAGGYYAWGEMTPRDGKFSSNEYTFKDKVTYDLTLLGRDAARQDLGGSWRMPTWSEFAELMNNCKTLKDSYDDTHGWRFVSEKEGFKNIEIFFPLTGNCEENGLHGTNEMGYYWTSTPFDHYSGNYACCFMMTRDQVNTGDTEAIIADRWWGMQIRPVYTP